MNVNVLTTKGAVDRAVAALSASVVGDETTAELEAERVKLLELKQALKSGDYIVVDPDLSGFRYVTCHFLPDTGLKEHVRGHERIVSVAALALKLGQPVVVGGEMS